MIEEIWNSFDDLTGRTVTKCIELSNENASLREDVETLKAGAMSNALSMQYVLESVQILAEECHKLRERRREEPTSEILLTR